MYRTVRNDDGLAVMLSAESKNAYVRWPFEAGSVRVVKDGKEEAQLRGREYYCNNVLQDGRRSERE